MHVAVFLARVSRSREPEARGQRPADAPKGEPLLDDAELLRAEQRSKTFPCSGDEMDNLDELADLSRPSLPLRRTTRNTPRAMEWN